jgi:hypothetical protein
VIRTTAFVHLRPDAAPARVDELIDAARHAAEATDAIAADASRVTSNAFRAGDVMLLGAFPDQRALEHALGSAHVTGVLRPLLAEVGAHVEVVRYAQGATTIREPGLTGGIHRSLLIHVNPDTDPLLVGRFEHELAAMPHYIDAIRNSSLSRIDTMRESLGPEYTHVWEQEFATLDGLTGPYMQDAYHWSVIDPWFDVQAPRHIVHAELIHSSCELRRSILALA